MALVPITPAEINEHIDKYPFGKAPPIINRMVNVPLTIGVGEKQHVIFQDCTFDASVMLALDENEMMLDFRKCIFNREIRTYGSAINIFLRWVLCEIRAGMEIDNVELLDLHLGSSFGNGEFIFRNIKFKQVNCNSFKWVEENRSGGMQFSGCAFQKNYFQQAEIFNATFNDCLFLQVANFDNVKLLYDHAPADGNFSSVTFYENAYFSNVNYSMGAFFTSSIFKKLLMMTGANEDHDNCQADFSACRFEGRAFLDTSRFKGLSMHNAEFLEFASFKNVVSGDIELNRTLFAKGADFIGAKIKTGDRESFRTIKSEFLRLNNLVEASHFNAKEMDAYEKEMKWSWDKFMLLANRWSNGFGQSWFRGVKFTVIAAAVLFFAYYWTLGDPPVTFGWNGWDAFWSALNSTSGWFLKFFTITHNLDFMEIYSPNAVNYLIDMLARIIIGYGIYQTIQAFRKYGK